MLKEFELTDVKALDYIRGQLSMGNTLARHLLHQNLEKGRITTYMPSTYTLEMCYRFEETIVVDESPRIQWLSPLILKHLQIANNHHGIVENAYAKPTDPYIQEYDPSLVYDRTLIYDNEVYHWLHKSMYKTVDAITKAIRGIPTHPSVGVLTSLPENVSLRKGQQITEEHLVSFALRTTHIITCTYDDTGYLLWQRV